MGNLQSFWKRYHFATLGKGDWDTDDGGTQQSPRFNIAYLIERTKFTRAELIAMYRNFKSTSPNGWMTHERLTIDLDAIFPSGDASMFARYVMQAICPSTRAGDVIERVSFEDYVCAMSALCRGSVEDKLRIAYRMYDTDMDGQISPADWQRFISSVYALLGSVCPPVDRFHIRQHSSEISRRYTANHETCTCTWEQFIRAALADEQLLRSFINVDIAPC